MIVRDFNRSVEGDPARVVSDAQWTPVRLLLEGDGMGFSFQITQLDAGSEHTLASKNHFDSVSCMKGTGSITDLATGQTHEITPGVMYALDKARPPYAARRGGVGDGLRLQPARRSIYTLDP